eukprot:COSAG02_NODE_1690_length_11299_cov_21.781071_2_plen_225_part_00
MDRLLLSRQRLSHYLSATEALVAASVVSCATCVVVPQHRKQHRMMGRASWLSAFLCLSSMFALSGRFAKTMSSFDCCRGGKGGAFCAKDVAAETCLTLARNMSRGGKAGGPRSVPMLTVLLALSLGCQVALCRGGKGGAFCAKDVAAETCLTLARNVSRGGKAGGPRSVPTLTVLLPLSLGCQVALCRGGKGGAFCAKDVAAETCLTLARNMSRVVASTPSVRC